MQNEPGSGPTRPDKTTERMAQERLSPGAMSADGDDAARRGDVAGALEEATMPRSDAAPELRSSGNSTAATTREERIREAAYRISQSREDGSTGDATTDWLQAEAEVDAQDQNGPG